jgi:hypothetical protein
MSESKRDTETEDELISQAQNALSQCQWVVGECAAKWTKRYARGRTDSDFAALIGISGDQVYQRRRVWEVFAEVRDSLGVLNWSHFYAALTWNDGLDCLRWAEETRTTVAEMRAWRRARRGEDLSVDEVGDEAVRFLPEEPKSVHDPAEFGGGAARDEADSSSGQGERPLVAGVARQGGTEGEEYAPFRSGAGSIPPAEGLADTKTAVAVRTSTEQIAKRLSSTLERIVKLMTPEFRREFRRLPEPVKARFMKAADELHAKVAALK